MHILDMIYQNEESKEGHIENMPIPLYRRHLSIEHRRKIGEFWKGKKQSQELINKRMASLNRVRKEKEEKGIDYISEEGRKRISESKKGIPRTPEVIEKMRQAALGKRQSDATKQKHREKGKIAWDKADKETRDRRLSGLNEWIYNPIYKSERSGLTKRRWENPEYREKNTNGIAKAQSEPKAKEHHRQAMIKLWSDADYRDNIIKRSMKANHAKPNLVELKLKDALDNNYPEYKYTGDGSIIIGGHCPDFTNVNGQKKVILLHGIYWHLWIHQKKNPDLTKEQVEQKDIEHYKRFGFDTLIIWEDEMDNPQSVLEKVWLFNRH